MRTESGIGMASKASWKYHQDVVAKQTLGQRYPDICSFFDRDRAPDVIAEELFVTSPGSFPWTCTRGHHTDQSVRGRIKGCSDCSGRKFLDEHHPELLAEFDQEAQPDTNPSSLYSRSEGVFFWKCSKQPHSWPATVSARIRGSGCTYCAGLATLAGFNDILSVLPADARVEWLFDRNLDESGNPVDPSQIAAWDTEPRFWRCLDGDHTRETSPSVIMNGVAKGRRCRTCAGFGAIAGRTDALSAIPELRQLLDRDLHEPTELTRVSPGSEKIFNWKCHRNPKHRWERSIRLMRRSSLCPDCNGQRLTVGENDLLSQAPDFAAEWDHYANANDPLVNLHGPDQITVGSPKVVHWVCSRGHTWQQTPNGRVGQNLGCRYCSDRRCWPGFNDLKTKRPDLVSEIDSEEHAFLDPSKLLWNSHNLVSWVCERNNDHRWQAPVWYRTKGQTGRPKGCPDCNTSGFSPSSPYILYYLEHSEMLASKVGITKQGSTRVRSYVGAGWSCLFHWRFERGKEALLVEKSFHDWREIDCGLPNFLGPEDMPARLGGHVETFSLEALSAHEVRSFIEDQIRKRSLAVDAATGPPK